MSDGLSVVRSRAWRGAILVGVLVMVGTMRGVPARAACNTIPPAALSYQSSIGGVQDRLAAPGTMVNVVHRSCDAGPFFDATPANNEVRITFTPDPNDPSLDTLWPPITPTEVRCDAITGVCARLVFRWPDTASGAHPHGLAGLARIEVVNKVAIGGGVAARIEKLSALSHTCQNAAPDEDFGAFTALPKPNAINAIGTGTAIRAALDGYGNLLVPLDHTGAKGGVATRALFEIGFADFCAEAPWWGNVCNLFATRTRIHNRLADNAHARVGLQAFSVEGHRLAPIIDHDDNGAIFGLADGDVSVIRIANDVGGKNLDLTYLKELDPQGPLLFGHKTAGASVAGNPVCRPVTVQGARKTRELVGLPDESRQLWVHDVATGGRDCGVGTSVVADEVTLPTAQREAVVEADATLVATISGGHLRVFDEFGTELTSGKDPAATTAAVNDYALAVAGDRVFFRTPAGELAEWWRSTQAVSTLKAASQASVHGARAVALDAASPPGAWTYDAASGTTQALGVNGADVANGGDVVAVARIQAAGGPALLSAWIWPSGGTPGSRQDTTAVVDRDRLGTTAGCRGASGSCTTRAVIISSEADEKAHLNFDPDQTDHVLRLFRPAGPVWDEPFLPAAEFVTSDRYVAFRVPEDEYGDDLNGDKDQDDAVLHVLAFDGGPSFRVVSAGHAATGWDGTWHRLGWRSPYLVVDDEVLFLIDEAKQREDLDGDGRLTSVVLAIFHVPSQRLHIVPPRRFPNQFIFDRAFQFPGRFLARPVEATLALVGNGLAIGDVDADGMLDPFDSCVTRANLRQRDDDHDGLGDRVCDPSYCTDFVPPARVAGAPVALSGTALDRVARDYIEARARAENECLATLARERLSRVDADVACRAGFVGHGENPGLFWSGRNRRALAHAEARFLRALGVAPGGGHSPAALARYRYGRRVIRAYGEAVDAATRVALGPVRRLPRLAEAQAEVSAAVTARLATLVVALQQCVREHRRGDLEAECFGRIVNGALSLPAGIPAALPLPGAELLRRTKGCARDGDTSCLGCTVWRNAVRAVLTLHGEDDPPEDLGREPDPKRRVAKAK